MSDEMTPGITVECRCIGCGEEVTIVPDRYDGFTPVSGECPKCGVYLAFGFGYLKSFTPLEQDASGKWKKAGMEEGDTPTSEITIEATTPKGDESVQN